MFASFGCNPLIRPLTGGCEGYGLTASPWQSRMSRSRSGPLCPWVASITGVTKDRLSSRCEVGIPANPQSDRRAHWHSRGSEPTRWGASSRGERDVSVARTAQRVDALTPKPGSTPPIIGTYAVSPEIGPTVAGWADAPVKIRFCQRRRRSAMASHPVHWVVTVA